MTRLTKTRCGSSGVSEMEAGRGNAAGNTMLNIVTKTWHITEAALASQIDAAINSHASRIPSSRTFGEDMINTLKKGLVLQPRVFCYTRERGHFIQTATFQQYQRAISVLELHGVVERSANEN